MTKIKLIIIGVIAVAVIILVSVYLKSRSLSEEEIINQSVNAVMTDNVEKLEELMYNPIIESGCELEDISEEELIGEMISVEDFYDSEEDFTFEVNDKVYLAEDYPDYLDDIEESLCESLEDIGMDIDFDIEDALYASVTVTSSDDEEEDYEFVFYQIDGSWYLLGVE